MVDDIADSFDYKNKYAIIQYLKDVADEGCFSQVILTHNFDFFRTINSRFVRYSHCLMVERTKVGLTLVSAAGIKNIFVRDWKPAFFTHGLKRIAAISFLRNIIEYTRGEDNPGYHLLTALLHWKSNTASITHGQLDEIYRTTFSEAGAWADADSLVIDTIRTQAAACLGAPEGTNFENKVVLAIAIRLEAERHMCAKIGDAAFTGSITSNQTARLVKRYKTVDGVTSSALDVLDQVALMTPENIHLNSFMYEPIIDLADDHLRALHKKVAGLG